MTQQQLHPNHLVKSESTSRLSVRLELKPVGKGTGFVDGAWWPRGLDLRAELPALMQGLSARLPWVERVIYHLAEWDAAPSRIEIDGRTVRLDGYRFQPMNTVYVIGSDRSRLSLLVVPPRTDAAYAGNTMATAATANNAFTSNELLLMGAHSPSAN